MKKKLPRQFEGEGEGPHPHPHLTMVSSDQCSTLWKVADWSHSMKFVKNFSIQSRRSGTLTKSESLKKVVDNDDLYFEE